MNALASLIDERLGRAIGWALVHSLWQGLIAALLLALALRVLDRRAAKLRYAIACVVLMGMALAPLATGVVIYEESAPVALSLPGVSAPPQLEAAPRELPPRPADAGTSRVPSILGSAQTFRWLAFGWVLGVCLSALRLFTETLGLHRLARTAVPAPARWQLTVDRLAHALRVPRLVRLLESSRVSVPCAMGWLRPMILLPASALSGLSPRELEMILAHELAHIRRHDFAMNVAQRLIETVFFYHPAVRWTSGVIRTERENCCDDDAVRACGNPVAYARALTELEALRLEPRGAMAGRNAVLSALGGSLGSRVRRLIAPRTNVSSRRVAGASLLAFASTAALAASVSLASIAHAEHPAAATAVPAAPTPAADAGSAPAAKDKAPSGAPPTPSPKTKVRHSKPNPLLPRKAASSSSNTWVAPGDPSDSLAVQQPHLTAPSPAPSPEAAPSPSPSPSPSASPRTGHAQATSPTPHVLPVPPVAAAAPVPPAPPPAPADRFDRDVPEAPEPPEPPEAPQGFDFDEGESGQSEGMLSEAQREQIREQVRRAKEEARAARERAREQMRAEQERMRQEMHRQHEELRRQERERERAEREQARDREEQQRERQRALDEADRVRAEANRDRERAAEDARKESERQSRWVAKLDVHPQVSVNPQPMPLDVDPRYATSMNRVFGHTLSSSELAGLQMFGVTPEYVTAMRDSGLGSLSPRELETARMVGVDPEYVRSLRSAGVDVHDVEDAYRLRTLGVDGAFAEGLRRAGMHPLSSRELVKLRALGVDGEYVQSMRAAGVTDLSPENLVRMRSRGIEPGDVRSGSERP